MREQDRTLECEHSIYGLHKQVNLGERTWNDDLRAMSYSLGIAIVVLVAEQNVILQTCSGHQAVRHRSAPGQKRAASAPFLTHRSLVFRQLEASRYHSDSG